MKLEPLAVIANLPEEATAPKDRSVNLVKVILEVELETLFVGRQMLVLREIVHEHDSHSNAGSNA